MKTSTMNLELGSLLSIGGAIFAYAAYRLDQMESVDADKDPEEKGLTQSDSTLKSEWVANGFPQTHMDMEDLGEEFFINLNVLLMYF